MQSDEIVVKIDDELKDLAPTYLENRRKDIASIKDALAKQDYEQIKVLAHRMKGSGASYGFSEISEIGREMEEAAKEKDAQRIAKSLASLEHYVNHVRIL